jgi:hypothetical protein
MMTSIQMVSLVLLTDKIYFLQINHVENDYPQDLFQFNISCLVYF